MNENQITWQEFEEQIKVLELTPPLSVLEGEWFVYVHPLLLKHHPTVKYLRRYSRRGERMKKRKKKK